jgi:hypothetical protein
MRHTLFLLSALVVLAAGLAAPLAVSAASAYTYTVRSDRCTGPTYQKSHFEATETAAGSTPANSLTIDSWAEVFTHGAWHTFYVWPEQHKNFTPDGSSHSLTSSRTFGDPPHSVRIAMQLQIWRNGTLLSHKVFLSGTC